MGAYVKELFTDCAPQAGGTDAAWREPCADGRDEPGHMSSLTSIDELSKGNFERGGWRSKGNGRARQRRGAGKAFCNHNCLHAIILPDPRADEKIRIFLKECGFWRV